MMSTTLTPDLETWFSSKEEVDEEISTHDLLGRDVQGGGLAPVELTTPSTPHLLEGISPPTRWMDEPRSGNESEGELASDAELDWLLDNVDMLPLPVPELPPPDNPDSGLGACSCGTGAQMLPPQLPSRQPFAIQLQPSGKRGGCLACCEAWLLGGKNEKSQKWQSFRHDQSSSNSTYSLLLTPEANASTAHPDTKVEKLDVFEDKVPGMKKFKLRIDLKGSNVHACVKHDQSDDRSQSFRIRGKAPHEVANQNKRKRERRTGSAQATKRPAQPSSPPEPLDDRAYVVFLTTFAASTYQMAVATESALTRSNGSHRELSIADRWLQEGGGLRFMLVWVCMCLVFIACLAILFAMMCKLPRLHVAGEYLGSLLERIRLANERQRADFFLDFPDCFLDVPAPSPKDQLLQFLLLVVTCVLTLRCEANALGFYAVAAPITWPRRRYDLLILAENEEEQLHPDDYDLTNMTYEERWRPGGPGTEHWFDNQLQAYRSQHHPADYSTRLGAHYSLYLLSPTENARGEFVARYRQEELLAHGSWSRFMLIFACVLVAFVPVEVCWRGFISPVLTGVMAGLRSAADMVLSYITFLTGNSSDDCLLSSHKYWRLGGRVRDYSEKHNRHDGDSYLRRNCISSARMHYLWAAFAMIAIPILVVIIAFRFSDTSIMLRIVSAALLYPFVGVLSEHFRKCPFEFPRFAPDADQGWTLYDSCVVKNTFGCPVVLFALVWKDDMHERLARTSFRRPFQVASVIYCVAFVSKFHQNVEAILTLFCLGLLAHFTAAGVRK